MFFQIWRTLEDFGEFGQIDKLLESQEIDIGLENHPSNNTVEAKELYKRLGIEKSKYSMKEWMNIVGKMMDKFQNDDSIIREARRYSKKHLQLEKFKVNIDEINFNENLAKTVIGKSFMELLEEQLEIGKSKDGVITRFNRVTTAFNLLNFFGFDNERNKKVKFLSTQHDGEHCWYASTCDIIVSEDKGFKGKTKFLYNLYGQSSKVFSIKEFSTHLNLTVGKDILTYFEFQNLINYDLRNELIVSSNISIKRQQKDEIIKLNKRYFNHFNRLSKVILFSDNTKHLILYRDAYEINSYIFTKDFVSVTNYSFKAFGADDFFKKGFDEKDKKQFDENNWDGRIWTRTNAILRLLKNPLSGKINLQISLLGNEFNI